jgi:hypothetical protein
MRRLAPRKACPHTETVPAQSPSPHKAHLRASLFPCKGCPRTEPIPMPSLPSEPAPLTKDTPRSQCNLRNQRIIYKPKFKDKLRYPFLIGTGNRTGSKTRFAFFYLGQTCYSASTQKT